MVLDRALQHEILERMAEVYPGAWDHLPFRQERRVEVGDLIKNLVYLREHGLVDMKVSPVPGIPTPVSIGSPKITAKGLDFLADDGGLTAVLGVVTIKIHNDTLRQLLGRIDQMPGSEAEKDSLRQTLKDLPATAGKALLDRLVTLGVEHLPDTVETLHRWILAIGA